MTADAHVLVRTSRFDDDVRVLTDGLGFRVDAIFPADAPHTAVVSGHGIRLRLERAVEATPTTLVFVTDEHREPLTLPGGSIVEFRPRTSTFRLPESSPALVITRGDDGSAVGRAGMRYRDLIPGRWGGRFISSHITIPDGGPVPDYVHYHVIRFQLIFVKAGWVRVVYEDQGDPFVMHVGDAVLQPPEIRHRVLESSDHLEVIEIGCPAEHETIADWTTDLPTSQRRPDRDFGGQRFVRHVAAEATWAPWRIEGWDCRDTGIGAATDGLAGVRVARATAATTSVAPAIAHETEFAQLVVLAGSVRFSTDEVTAELTEGDSVAIPGGTRYRLTEVSADCELLDVTLPATFDVAVA